jgi:ABC-type bacteriocin/lantibiotic exporter with double-glycine peptidase domain
VNLPGFFFGNQEKQICGRIVKSWSKLSTANGLAQGVMKMKSVGSEERIRPGEKVTLFRLGRRKWPHLAVALLLFLAALGLQLALPLVMQKLVDEAIPDKDGRLITECLIGLVAFPVLAGILRMGAGHFAFQLGAYVTDRLRLLLFGKMLHHSPRVYREWRAGDLAVRIQDCGEIGDAYLAHTLVESTVDGVMMVVTTGILLSLNGWLALCSLLIVPVSVWAGVKAGNRFRTLFERVADLQRELSAYTVELVGGLKTVQAFNREEGETEAQEGWIATYRKLRNRVHYLAEREQVLAQFLESLALGVLFALGAWQIVRGTLTLGELLAVSVYVPQLFGAAKRVWLSAFKFNQLRPRWEAIRRILEREDERWEGRLSLDRVKGEVEFRRVHFTHGRGRGALTDISFRSEPGWFVAIVGPSGGGKSTLLDLMMGFYEPDFGEIWLDGMPLSMYDLHALREQVGWVSQDVFLWNRTIRENLLYACPHATEEELWEACAKARIADWIAALPYGMDTVVGERGVKMSGGERHRLAIARVLLRKPSLLLMDEPTSALDARTEMELMQEIRRMFRGKTVMVAAHRLSSVRNADLILVVQDGRVVEMGTHLQLMLHGGLYRELYERQMNVGRLEAAKEERGRNLFRQ